MRRLTDDDLALARLAGLIETADTDASRDADIFTAGLIVLIAVLTIAVIASQVMHLVGSVL